MYVPHSPRNLVFPASCTRRGEARPGQARPRGPGWCSSRGEVPRASGGAGGERWRFCKQSTPAQPARLPGLAVTGQRLYSERSNLSWKRWGTKRSTGGGRGQGRQQQAHRHHKPQTCEKLGNRWRWRGGGLRCWQQRPCPGGEGLEQELLRAERRPGERQTEEEGDQGGPDGAPPGRRGSLAARAARTPARPRPLLESSSSRQVSERQRSQLHRESSAFVKEAGS